MLLMQTCITKGMGLMSTYMCLACKLEVHMQTGHTGFENWVNMCTHNQKMFNNTEIGICVNGTTVTSMLALDDTQSPDKNMVFPQIKRSKQYQPKLKPEP